MDTITKQIEEIAEEFCNNYCKYPDKYDPEEHDGVELFESDICKNCPLNKIGVIV